MTDGPPTRYYHGGPPKMKVGGWILPPSKTGAPSSSEFGAEDVHRRDRVYLATTIAAAAIFAACHPSNRGRVYEVQPVGGVEPDPDWTGDPGESVQCKRARIVRIHPLTHADRLAIRRAVFPGVFS